MKNVTISVIALALTGCAAFAPTEQMQLSSKGPVGINHPCTFGGVTLDARIHCTQITYGIEAGHALAFVVHSEIERNQAKSLVDSAGQVNH